MTDNTTEQPDEMKLTLNEAHREFAIMFTEYAWDIMAKDEWDDNDDFYLIHTAHAALMHWTQLGDMEQVQRGLWLLARIYTLLEMPENAMIHAAQCLAVTEHENVTGTDKAYAFEAQARASALGEDFDTADEYYRKAHQEILAITDEEERDMLLEDLTEGPWFEFQAPDDLSN